MSRLEGKIALVTGGSRGIGAGIVRRLTTEGAQVAFTYPSVSDGPDAVLRSIADAGGKAWAFEADSSDPLAVEAAVDRTAEKASRLDILVNNAGIITVARLGEFSLQDFDRMVAINIRGVFVASKAASRHMSSGGRIITVGSCNADRMPFEGGSIYAMTKAAVAGLTRGMARDLGPRGITVNTVQPGPTNTDLNPVDGPYAPTFLPMLAVQRFAHVDEIAGMVAYLASPEAAFVTGAMLTIDGGFNA
jgi:3-oxoacyl-[acyl-carrier protein] reductase